MDSPADLTIVFGEDASAWDSYLGRCFEGLVINSASAGGNMDGVRSGLHIHHQCIEELSTPLTASRARRFRQSKAQIVILSPDMLEFVLGHPSLVIGQLFEPTRVIALLCGITEEEVTPLHRAGLVSYDSWQRMTVVENDQDYVLRLLKRTIEVIECGERPQDATPKYNFKLVPRKVREGCSKVCVELLCAASIDEIASVLIESDTESITVPAKIINPYLIKFIVPDGYFGISQILTIHVTHGSTYLGSRQLKCESKMAELNQLLQSLLHPLSFMCQTLGLPSNHVEELDRLLAENFKKHLPRMDLTPSFEFSQTENQKVEEECPSWLHFSAKHGLRELCAVLLDFPTTETTCRQRNCRGLTPAELADNEGHHCIASMLENYMSLSETAEMYICMQSIANNVDSADYQNIESFLAGRPNTFRVSCSSDSKPHRKLLKEINRSSSSESTPRPESDVSEELTAAPRRRSTGSGPGTGRVDLYTPSQQELLQLLEDFKRDNYTLPEVELLFNNWQLRQRNSSFKEKEEQLLEMKMHYEKIQKDVNADAKKSSALERFRNFWHRSMKKDTNTTAVPKIDNVYTQGDMLNPLNSQCRPKDRSRPVSAWSNASSGSSGSSDRFSTASVISSTGDSGHLSDLAEDRLVPNSSRKVDGMPKTLSRPLSITMKENLQYFHCSASNPPLPLKPAQVTSQPTVPSASAVYSNVEECKSFRPPLPARPSFLKLPKSKPQQEERHDYMNQLPRPNDHCQQKVTGLKENTNTGNTTTECQRIDVRSLPKGSTSTSAKTSAPITEEPDYYNIREFMMDYVDMQGMDQGVHHSKEPNVTNSEQGLWHATPIYVNLTDMDECEVSDGEHCDSVPDFPPPPIPRCRP